MPDAGGEGEESLSCAGEDAGGKLRKANELGVRVINEDEFEQMIR